MLHNYQVLISVVTKSLQLGKHDINSPKMDIQLMTKYITLVTLVPKV
jgi:hypothetical protein